MPNVCHRLALPLGVLALLAGGSGCGIHHHYSTGSIHPIAGGESLDAVATEALDARAAGGPFTGNGTEWTDNDMAQSLVEVRVAVAEHLVRAGVVADRPALPAPTTAAEVDAALATARAQGAREVIFVRYHRGTMANACGSTAVIGFYFGLLPWIILDSIPLWSHGGLGAFEVIVASTETGEVLGRSARAAAFSEHVSAWGCGADGVMHDMMRRSLQRALEDVVAQAGAGWPLRSGASARDAVLAPSVHMDGTRVAGLGWALEAPEGFRPEPFDMASVGPSLLGSPERAVRLLRTDAELIEVQVVVTSDYEANFASHAFDPFRSNGALVSEEEATVSGHGARRGVLQVEGSQVHMLAVGALGMGFVVVCGGSQAVCEPVLRSFVVTDELIADGRRSDPH